MLEVIFTALIPGTCTVVATKNSRSVCVQLRYNDYSVTVLTLYLIRGLFAYRSCCTHVRLRCTHVRFRCTHVRLRCTHVRLRCTHVCLRCTHVRLRCT